MFLGDLCESIIWPPPHHGSWPTGRALMLQKLRTGFKGESHDGMKEVCRTLFKCARLLSRERVFVIFQNTSGVEDGSMGRTEGRPRRSSSLLVDDAHLLGCWQTNRGTGEVHPDLTLKFNLFWLANTCSTKTSGDTKVIRVRISPFFPPQPPAVRLPPRKQKNCFCFEHTIFKNLLIFILLPAHH